METTASLLFDYAKRVDTNVGLWKKNEFGGFTAIEVAFYLLFYPFFIQSNFLQCFHGM